MPQRIMSERWYCSNEADCTNQDEPGVHSTEREAIICRDGPGAIPPFG